MGKIEGQSEQRPNYYHGQLLQEDDFLREQQYHVAARQRHNTNLHGVGVVSGLELIPNGIRSAVVRPGCAIDPEGNEMIINRPVTLDLRDYEAGDALRIGLLFEEADIPATRAAKQKTRGCMTWVTVTRAAEKEMGMPLALARLDDTGALKADEIEYPNRLDTIRPGSITAGKLHAHLKKGWLRLPFRPDPLVNIPQGEKEIPPAFRVGATRALSPDPSKADAKDRGAAGTMGIPIPPNATRISRFRIAGDQNEGEIDVSLCAGGWDEANAKHLRVDLAREKIRSPGPFHLTIAIDNGRLDPEYNTLSIWLRGTKRTSVSLVAAEFVYHESPASS